LLDYYDIELQHLNPKDLAHRGLHHVMRGVPGDQAALQVVEVLLRHLPA
jgi:hypothetical protein